MSQAFSRLYPCLMTTLRQVDPEWSLLLAQAPLFPVHHQQGKHFMQGTIRYIRSFYLQHLSGSFHRTTNYLSMQICSHSTAIQQSGSSVHTYHIPGPVLNFGNCLTFRGPSPPAHGIPSAFDLHVSHLRGLTKRLFAPVHPSTRTVTFPGQPGASVAVGPSVIDLDLPLISHKTNKRPKSPST